MKIEDKAFASLLFLKKKIEMKRNYQQFKNVNSLL